MNYRIIPPGMRFETALRLGYTGEIRCAPYLAWIRTLDCHRCFTVAPSQASHTNFFKSQVNKGPDLLALPECPPCHQLYEDSGDPQEIPRLAQSALNILRAFYEGRLVWKSR